MKKISKYPIVFAFIIILIIGTSGHIKRIFQNILLNNGYSDFTAKHFGQICAYVIIVIVCLFIIKYLKLKDIAGLNAKNKLKNKWLLIAPLLFVAFSATNITKINWDYVNAIDLILLLFSALLIGAMEEISMRGLIQSNFIDKYYKKKNGVFISVIITSILFGLIHFSSAINGRENPNYALVIAATFIGVFFGAILLRTNKLYIVVISHGLFNFFVMLNGYVKSEMGVKSSGTDSSNYGIVLFFIPILIFGLWQLTKVKKQDLKTNTVHNSTYAQ